MAIPFYRYSFETAQSDRCEDLYRESLEENRRCRDYIQDSETGFYAKAYKDNCVDTDRAYTKELIQKFGMERVMFMYACTVKQAGDDGRISQEVKAWAENFDRCNGVWENWKDSYAGQIHVGMIDILAKHAIEEYEGLNLFTAEHCEEEFGDLEGKVVIINPKYLKEEYWSPENQLWLATGGFGCSPTAKGQAVYATCLIDGDKNRWDRSCVLGVMKDEYLPDWAREKLAQMQEMDEPEQEMQQNELNLG